MTRFRIPWVPPSNNRALRMHWTKRDELVRVAATHVLAVAGRPSTPEWARVRVRIVMRRRRPMDQDNAYGAVKPLVDALVRLGYAVDDSRRWMRLTVAPVGVARNLPPWTEITVNAI
jgi:hypothetical protein